MRKISVSTCFDYSIPIERQLPMIADAGFTHVSIGNGDDSHSGILTDEGAVRLKGLLCDNGLAIDTVHGHNLDKPDAMEVNERLARAAAYLGAPVVVIHASSFAIDPATAEVRYCDVMAKLPELRRLSEKYGVVFAFENLLPGAATDLAMRVLDAAPPEYFGFCYDSSHHQIGGPHSFEFLEQHAHRLRAVHISDRVREFVDHVLPGEGFVDFSAMCAALRAAKMDFPLLLEVMTTHSVYKNPEEFLSEAYKRAADLWDAIFS